MTRLIFLGPPGAGKGTQAALLANDCEVPHISTGDILRSAVAAGSELGQKADHYMSTGELVPDDLILDLIEERLGQKDAQLGWLLDGFPRNVPQAEFLQKILDQIDQPADFVVNLDVEDAVIVARLLQRGRKDDEESVILNRLEVYRQQTEPLIEFYRDRQQLVSVDGNQTMEAVYAALKSLVME
ncbi:adenylate kinase [Nodosilinea sp. LEGE 07088]|uniref:adenylate kinase n=1 Tax=Nodosilinea sp. LEGE 07088 TaxID=2777968 RepID=UPI00187F0570|nr:adenylate kinase [Nodosilinea sp. LEGE 07088]MBE9137241.1 adenylate kinase [Nodosilinea sp. LEGE 07088]